MGRSKGAGSGEAMDDQETSVTKSLMSLIVAGLRGTGVHVGHLIVRGLAKKPYNPADTTAADLGSSAISYCHPHVFLNQFLDTSDLSCYAWETALAVFHRCIVYSSCRIFSLKAMLIARVSCWTDTSQLDCCMFSAGLVAVPETWR